MLKIRKEVPADYQAVEELTRRAFYNLYVPGCVEHYLVHIMREHGDFIPELALVAQLDGEVIGNIMYTKARLVDETGIEKTVLTFGPVCIAPEHQREGYGKALIEESSAGPWSWAMTRWSFLEVRPTMSPGAFKAAKNTTSA